MANEKSEVKEIRANSFVLEDENGNARASLALAKDGRLLLLMDENGKRRLGLVLLEHGTALSLIGEGKAKASLQVGKFRSCPRGLGRRAIIPLNPRMQSGSIARHTLPLLSDCEVSAGVRKISTPAVCIPAGS